MIKHPKLFPRQPVLTIIDGDALLDSVSSGSLNTFLTKHDQQDKNALESISRKFKPKINV